jgi:lactoylglutathione lyase
MILYVKDLAASVAWYRDTVGLTVKVEGDGYVEFVTEGTRFGLFERSALPGLIGREAASANPAGEVAFLINDVGAQADRLRKAGVQILNGPTDRAWGHRTIHIADADGHLVEFAQEIPRA